MIMSFLVGHGGIPKYFSLRPGLHPPRQPQCVVPLLSPQNFWVLQKVVQRCLRVSLILKARRRRYDGYSSDATIVYSLSDG